MPTGGTTGEVLSKASATDYDTEWVAAGGPGGGPPGPPGDDGAAGPAGPAGADGNAGPPGPSGAAGSDGDAGPAGPAGAAGTDGTDGDDGMDGAAGPAGPAGPPGTGGGGADPSRTQLGVRTSIPASTDTLIAFDPALVLPGSTLIFEGYPSSTSVTLRGYASMDSDSWLKLTEDSDGTPFGGAATALYFKEVDDTSASANVIDELRVWRANNGCYLGPRTSDVFIEVYVKVSGGAPGADGPAGPAGPAGGPPGPPGAGGTDGADGNDGAAGPGPAGPAGSNGSDGDAGPAGADGADSTVAGPPGSDGSDGNDGAVGPAGPAGSDGSDATVGAGAEWVTIPIPSGTSSNEIINITTAPTKQTAAPPELTVASGSGRNIRLALDWEAPEGMMGWEIVPYLGSVRYPGRVFYPLNLAGPNNTAFINFNNSANPGNFRGCAVRWTLDETNEEWRLDVLRYTSSIGLSSNSSLRIYPYGVGV